MFDFIDGSFDLVERRVHDKLEFHVGNFLRVELVMTQFAVRIVEDSNQIVGGQRQRRLHYIFHNSVRSRRGTESLERGGIDFMWCDVEMSCFVKNSELSRI